MKIQSFGAVIVLSLTALIFGCATEDESTPSATTAGDVIASEDATEAEDDSLSLETDTVETDEDVSVFPNKDTSTTGDTEENTEEGEEGEEGCVTAEDCAFESPISICWEAVCDDAAECLLLPQAEGTPCGDASDLCAGSDGKCSGDGTCIQEGPVLVCDDQNGCTTDTCDPATGCVFTPTTEGCDDGDVCTADDVCDDGACVGSSPLNCDDENACTFDSCDAVNGCLNDEVEKEGSPCNDGETCTLDDTCQNGACVPGNPADIEEGTLDCTLCSEESPCAQTEDMCDGEFECLNGFCKETLTNLVSCNDFDPCTLDACNPIDGSCTNSPEENGVACDDGDACTENTACLEGSCTGDAIANCVPGCGASPNPGCDGCECEDCVCAIDSFCCDTQWDESCVTLCTDDCGMGCGPVEASAGCSTSNNPGCDGCDCEACVCAADNFCCATSWDSSCVASCEGCGTVCPQPEPGDCEPGEVPDCIGGCIYDTWPGDGICDSVLNCEETNFDEGDCAPCYPSCEGKNCGPDGCGGTCGACEGTEFCYPDGVCQEPCGNGTCEVDQDENCSTCETDCDVCAKSTGCETSDQPTCGGCACEECVCAQDSLCCETAWDSSCVLLCINECGGCEYDSGCFENIQPGIGGVEGACSADAVACMTIEECVQPEACPAPPEPCVEPAASTCVGTMACSADGTTACVLDTDCTQPDACPEPCVEPSPNVCENFVCSADPQSEGADQPSSCTDDSDCVQPEPCPEPCVEPTPNSCTETFACSGDATLCTGDEDCAQPEPCPEPVEPCVEPDPNSCEGASEEIPEVMLPGCDGCGCEDCVCAAHPECCDVAWDESCSVACQSECDTPCGLDVCTSNIDCFDGIECTDEVCTANGICDYPINDSCCQADSDCDDSDSCTANTCDSFGQCQMTAAYDAACCPEDGAVFNADFESTIPFTVSNSVVAGGWQISTAQSKSATHSLWYGSKVTGDLNFGASNGSFTSEVMLLPDSFTLSFGFSIWSDIAAPLQVSVLLENGTQELIWSEIPANAEEWNDITVDLTPWHGMPVSFQFSFSTGGATAKGIYVDDIFVTSDCSYPVCGDGTCNGIENCFTCDADCATPDTCPENDGCNAWEYPGCVNCPCEADVCAENPSCCDVAWDNECVTACGNTDAQDCGPKPGCVNIGVPGCDGCECEACVCAADSFCCNSSWDTICISACKTCSPDYCGPTVCADNQVVNCNDGCTTATWISDGFCDSVLNCVETDFDGGDCADDGGPFF